MYTAYQADSAGYASAALSLFILISRLLISRWRQERIDLSFWLVVVSIAVITSRIVTNYYYLQFGTASDVLAHVGDLDSTRLGRIKTGSILVLLARVLMTAALWLQVSLLLLFYSRITSGIPLVAWTIKVTWITLISTFIACVLSTFLECRPIHLYWQVAPNPGRCVHAYAQLLVQGICNIILDLLLIVVAFPLIRLRKRTWSQYLSLYGLFTLGTFCMVITILRIVLIFSQGSSQTTRSLWASVQIVVATFVANAPTIYGSIRLRVVRGRQSTASGDGSRSCPRRRPSCPITESWVRIDEDIPPSSIPLRPLYHLPPASTLHHEQRAVAHYGHSLSTPSTFGKDDITFEHTGEAV